MHRDEQAIREVISKWMSATQAGDIDAVLNLVTGGRPWSAVEARWLKLVYCVPHRHQDSLQQ